MMRLTVSEITCAPAGESSSGGGTLAQAKDTITRTARETTDKLKSAASDTASRTKAEAERIATEKKQTAADRVAGYSSAIHESARSLEEKDPNIAWFTHRTADRLQSVADYMRNRDFGGLREDAENLARRHPAAFFGGLFVAGLILGNVVKASRRSSSSRFETDDLSPTEEATEDFPPEQIPTLPATGI